MTSHHPPFSIEGVGDGRRYSTNLMERISHDSDGQAPPTAPLARGGGNVKNDDSVNSTDGNIIDALAAGAGTLITDSAYNADADINRDGQVNEDDGTFFAALPASAPLNGAGSGVISDPDGPHGPDNVLGYCGYVFNREHRNYTVRYRTYFPELGRWGQRDPAGYVGSFNLF